MNLEFLLKDTLIPIHITFSNLWKCVIVLIHILAWATTTLMITYIPMNTRLIGQFTA